MQKKRTAERHARAHARAHTRVHANTRTRAHTHTYYHTRAHTHAHKQTVADSLIIRDSKQDGRSYLTTKIQTGRYRYTYLQKDKQIDR